jgi:thiol-disulfide isomerase/thioredoxin
LSKLVKDKKELDSLLKDSPGIFVLFYGSWCPFCVKFLPVFEQAALNSKMQFCRIMSPECEDLYSIDVVPTVIFFKDGKVEKRLDGLLGVGLTGQKLDAMIDSCKA